MDPDSYIVSGIVLVVSALLFVFFAGAEVAFQALLETSPLELKKKRSKGSKRIESLLANGHSLLLAIKLARWVTTVSLVSACAFVSFLVAELFGLPGWLILFLVVVPLTVFFFAVIEIWTGRFVLSNSAGFAQTVSLPLLLYYKTVSPFTNTLAKFLRFVSVKFKLNGNGLSHRGVLAMVEDANGNELEEDEREMIHSIIEFGETQVHEVMIPRTDMVCVEDKADVKRLVMLIKEKGHSRIPLYSDDVDNILGIIHIKDLLPYIGAAAEAKSPNLLRLARPAYFVPETKKLDRLLHEFRQEKGHMAIVVDEYGGTAGLVTLEDVIEEIIGDIQDEYDKEAPLFKKIEKNVYDVDAKIGLDELNDALDFDLPTDGDYESLGGFILNLTGYVPDENEVVRYENYDFLVEVVVRNRIKRVRLTVNQAEQEEET